MNSSGNQDHSLIYLEKKLGCRKGKVWFMVKSIAFAVK
jgi:hypothetical protein